MLTCSSTRFLWLTLVYATACRDHGATRSDPLALDRELVPLEHVAVRIVAAGRVRAHPEGPDLGEGAAAPEQAVAFDAALMERREGWVRLVTDVAPLRLALWIPEERVELANLDTPGVPVIDMAPTWSDASWVELELGARIFDRPGGTAFGVMLRDGALRWCDGRPEDGAVDVCISTLWGELRGTVMCPCMALTGAGG